MPKPQIPVIVADIAKASDDGQIFYIYKMDLNQGFQIDGFAGEICSSIDGQSSLTEIVHRLEEKYELERGYFDSEIKKLVQKLESLRALQWLDKPLAKR